MNQQAIRENIPEDFAEIAKKYVHRYDVITLRAIRLALYIPIRIAVEGLPISRKKLGQFELGHLLLPRPIFEHLLEFYIEYARSHDRITDTQHRIVQLTHKDKIDTFVRMLKRNMLPHQLLRWHRDVAGLKNPQIAAATGTSRIHIELLMCGETGTGYAKIKSYLVKASIARMQGVDYDDYY